MSHEWILEIALNFLNLTSLRLLRWIKDAIILSLLDFTRTSSWNTFLLVFYISSWASCSAEGFCICFLLLFAFNFLNFFNFFLLVFLCWIVSKIFGLVVLETISSLSPCKSFWTVLLFYFTLWNNIFLRRQTFKFPVKFSRTFFNLWSRLLTFIINFFHLCTLDFLRCCSLIFYWCCLSNLILSQSAISARIFLQFILFCVLL